VSDQALIDAWLAKNGGPRRFERGTSATADGVRGYLKDRGYTLEFTGWKQGGKARLKHEGVRGRPRLMTMRELLAFVDELRAAEGREPILGRAA
jgi:hypothetical protein